MNFDDGDECKANVLPVLWPNPLKQAEQVEIKETETTH
jgi:hypothetical protein